MSKRSNIDGVKKIHYQVIRKATVDKFSIQILNWHLKKRGNNLLKKVKIN